MSDLNSLLPVRRPLAPVLVPLVVLVLLLAGCLFAYFVFVQPVYDADAVKQQERSELLSSLSGFTVTEKLVEGDCLKLVLRDDREIRSLCVPEAVWGVNEVDKLFTSVELK